MLGEAARDSRLLHAGISYGMVVGEGGLSAEQLSQVSGEEGRRVVGGGRRFAAGTGTCSKRFGCHLSTLQPDFVSPCPCLLQLAGEQLPTLFPGHFLSVGEPEDQVGSRGVPALQLQSVVRLCMHATAGLLFAGLLFAAFLRLSLTTTHSSHIRWHVCNNSPPQRQWRVRCTT